MFIYNTTFHIDRECYSDFVAWLRNVYIPVTVQHGALSEPRLARIIVDEKRKAKMLHCNFLLRGSKICHAGIRLMARS